MDLIGDTYALSESDFTDVNMFEPGSKQPLSVEAIVSMMKKVKLPKLPGSKVSAGVAVDECATSAHDATAAATLQEVAGIITHMAKESLGALVTHPGHATVGVYYLAKRHQMIKLADHIDGKKVGDKELVERLIRYVDISDSIYPDRYPILVKQQEVVKETDIMFLHTQVHKLQPGFYIAVNHEDKTLMWVIRGTHDIHDILTDLCGVATPIPGGVAHWGMWRAAAWLLDTHWTRVLDYLQQFPGYNLEIIGHSMGAGVGALLALRLNTEEQFKEQLGSTKVTCVGVATAACLGSELAAAVSPYVTSLVMRYDLVPRFSAAQVDALQRELLAIDYKGLLHEDLMEHEVYRTALEQTTAVAQKVKDAELTQAAAAAVTTAATTVKSTTAVAAETAARELAAAGASAAAAGTVVTAKATAAGSVITATAASAAEVVKAKAAATSEVLAKQIEGALAATAAEGGTAAGPAAAVLQNPKVREAAAWVAENLKKGAAAGNTSNTAATAAATAEATAEATVTPDGEITTTTTTTVTAAAGDAAAAATVDEAASAEAAAAAAAVTSSSSTAVKRQPRLSDTSMVPPPAHPAEAPAGALESFEDSGEVAQVAAAAAAGEFVRVVLYAPGRLLYVRPVDEQVDEDKQHFELVDGRGDQRFKRIVLRSSCMTDHFPAAYKAGLTDVLQQVEKRQQQDKIENVQQGEQQQQQQHQEPAV